LIWIRKQHIIGIQISVNRFVTDHLKSYLFRRKKMNN